MNIKTKRGFTLIELMIVVAIIGILAAIAIPKFSQLVSKSNEANTKGNLGAIRSALSIYYGDMEGWYPISAANDGLATLMSNTKYLSAIPVAKLPTNPNNIGHGDSNTEIDVTGTPTDGVGWTYSATQSAATWGRVLVSCLHSDTKGSAWTSY